jgi:hypothetical protein
MNLRLRLPLLAALVVLAAGLGRAQTVTWGGGFPNDNFSVGSNWFAGTAPAINGTATVNFDGGSDSTLLLDESVSLLGLSMQGAAGNAPSPYIASGVGSTLTLGSGGISIDTDGTASGNFAIEVPLTLAASQTWSQANNEGGALSVDGAITGAYALTLAGDGNVETFVLTSPASQFSGGVTVTGQNISLVIGSSSTGPAGAPTSGPVGTGTLSLGDGTTLTDTGGQVTLANTLVVGDQTNSSPVIIGGPSAQGDPGQTVLTLSGPVTLNDSDLEIDIGRNSTVIFSGALTGYTPGVCLDFGSTNGRYSLAIVQGSLSNVSRLDLEDNVSVIFDGAGSSQITGLEDIGTSSTNYLGFGSGYASAGDILAALSFLTSTSAPNINGSLGFDTTSGLAATFNDPVGLAAFTAPGFVGLGSATSAILGPAAVITPPFGSLGVTYPFGGGGGTLTVESALADGTYPRGLDLAPGNAPLTLVLSGSLTYTGPTSVAGAALIFDTPPSSGTLSLTGGYLGGTANSGYTDANSNIQSFISLVNPASSTGVIGFDSLTGQRSVTSNINMTSVAPGLYLGTATSVDYSGTITPNGGDQYAFAGVKGGQVTVSSVLSGPNTTFIGLPQPIESFDESLGFVTQSSVILSGANTYSGYTTLNSGYLYVTNSNSLGTGTNQLVVPGNLVDGWAATLAAYGSAVDLSNPIGIGGNGLALNTGSPYVLTLSGNIHNHGSPGMLGIFGPVVLTGNNTYNGGTDIQATTVTIASNTGLGAGNINANGSTLTFGGANPVLAPQPGSDVTLTDDTAIFVGSPLINDLQMAESTLNFDGAAATINGLHDSVNSGDVINLTTGTVLTIDADGNGNNESATYHGVIEGPGSLVLTSSGGNSVDLRGTDTYTGGTTVTGGVAVIVSNDSALGTGPAAVNGGGIITNTGVTITNPITINGSVGNIAGVGGFGTFSPGGSMVFQNYGVVDPGSGGTGGGGNNQPYIPIPGTLTFGGSTSVTFGPTGGYYFSITDAAQAAGTGYGTVSMPGEALTITATPVSPFEILVTSYDPSTGLNANALNFSSSSSYSWTLVSAGSITGFNAGDFIIDSSNFTNGTGTGSFFVSQAGNDLLLNFTPVPEPSTWALMASGVFALGAAVRRRRR